MDYSKPVLIGYEGNRYDAVCSWGSAAIRIGDKIYNSNLADSGGTKIEDMDEEQWACIQKLPETQIPDLEWRELYVFDMPLKAFHRKPYDWYDLAVAFKVEEPNEQRGYRVFINHKLMTQYLIHMHNFNLMESK